MRHYALNMFVAFLILSVNQLSDIKEWSQVACEIAGKIISIFLELNEQYLMCLV